MSRHSSKTFCGTGALGPCLGSDIGTCQKVKLVGYINMAGCFLCELEWYDPAISSNSTLRDGSSSPLAWARSNLIDERNSLQDTPGGSSQPASLKVCCDQCPVMIPLGASLSHLVDRLRILHKYEAVILKLVLSCKLYDTRVLDGLLQSVIKIASNGQASNSAISEADLNCPPERASRNPDSMPASIYNLYCVG